MRRALITHVGLLGCFPSPMRDPQPRREVWVDPEKRLMGLGSFDFLAWGKIWAGEHESLFRACVVQEGFVLAGWLVLTLVTRSLECREFLTSSAWSFLQVTLLRLKRTWVQGARGHAGRWWALHFDTREGGLGPWLWEQVSTC